MEKGFTRIASYVSHHKVGFSVAPLIKHVLLAGNGTLFQDSLAHLLGKQPNLYLSRTLFTSAPALLKDIQYLQPDVVLVLSEPANMPAILSLSKTLTWTHAHPRIIIMDIESNILHLIDEAEDHAKSISIKNPQGFLNVLYE